MYSTIGNAYDETPDLGYFDLPNLKGRVPVGYDGSQGEFDNYGEKGGEKTHTLINNEMPSHNHTDDLLARYNGDYGGGADYSVAEAGANSAYFSTQDLTTNSTGGGQPHNNLQPYITLRYIIYVCDQPTPTPTPTNTPTPTSTPVYTGTPTIIYLPYTSAYTYTLTSGETLTVPVAASLGQIIISGVLLSIVAVLVVGFIFGVVYRE